MLTFARLFSAVISPLAAMALVLAVTGPAGAQAELSSSSPWAWGDHDLRHSKQSSLLGPLFPSSGTPAESDVKKWVGLDKLKTSFALSPDNQTIYAGMGFAICAVKISDMSKRWCVTLDADVSSAGPSVDQHGDVYLGDRDNSVTKFNTDPNLVCPPLDTKLQCRKIWQYNNGREGDVWTDPAIRNGWIYFANNQSHDGAGVVTAVDAVTGNWKWKYVLGNYAHTSSPAFDNKGVMYIGDKAGYLHAFKEIPNQTCQALPCPNVVRLWKQQIGYSITASPIVSADSKTLFVGSTNGLSAIDICDNVDTPGLSTGCVRPHGTLLWTFATYGAIGNTPALAADGTLYFGAKLGSVKTLYALNPGVCANSDASSCSHQTERWKYQINSGSEFSAFPIVGADGTVYAGLDRGVYAFRPSDGRVLWSYQTTNYILSSPIIGGSATSTGGLGQQAILFIGSTDKTLYAISGLRDGSGTQVNHAPTASAGATPTNAVAGQTVVSFNGTGTDQDGDALQYSWAFGDGATTPFAANANATHTYASANPDGTPKTYTATLTVDDGHNTNNIGTDQVQVVVSAPGGGGTPGSFSDGFNRPDSDVLGGPPGGPEWAEVKGNLEIKSNQLKFKVGPGTVKGDNIAVLPTLTGPNQSAEADFTSVDNNWGPRLGVVLGQQDPLNYYLLYRTAGGSVGVRISKVVNGVETILASKPVPAPTVNTPFHLKGTMNNNILTLILGPSQAPTATLSITNSTFSAGSLGILIGATYVLPYAADDFVAAATP